MTGDGTADRWARALVRLVIVGIALAAGTVLAGPGAWSTTGQQRADLVAAGRELYGTACVSCHGEQGRGVADRGPTLLEDGEAGVDFVMRTGRMPLSDPGQQGVRGPVRYDEGEIRALVAFVGQLEGQTGPALPEPDPAAGDAAAGGELFRTNCATCHQAAGQGGALVAATVPSLSLSSPTEVAEAMLVGPGAMPVFALEDDEVDDVTAYVEALQAQGNPGGFGVGRTGPFAEGLVAWGVGMLALLLFARWVGTRTSG